MIGPSVFQSVVFFCYAPPTKTKPECNMAKAKAIFCALLPDLQPLRVSREYCELISETSEIVCAPALPTIFDYLLMFMSQAE